MPRFYLPAYGWALALLFMVRTAAADPTELSLAAALQAAEEQSPALAAQRASVAAAHAAAIPAAALPDPKLVIGADNVPATGADRWRLERDAMTMEKIGVMQDVPNRAKRRARAEVASAAVAKAEARAAIERLKVRRETAVAWLNRFYLERQGALLGELEQENQLLGTAVRARLANGQGMAGDALMPQIEAADLADRRDEIRESVAQAVAELRRWVGGDAALPMPSAPPPLAFDAARLPEQLHRHPELAAYAPMAAMAAAEVREVEAEKRPDWSVELDYQRRAAPFGDMVSLQFTFDLPLFTGSRQTPRIEAKRLELERLDAERHALLREHTAELDADLASYAALRRQLARLQHTRLPLAAQKVELQMAAYRAGQAELAAVLAARRELIETRLRQIDLQRQFAALKAKLIFSYDDSATTNLAGGATAR